MSHTPQIVTTEPEQRQIADVLEFQPRFAPHINWETIGIKARELGANFEARWTRNGACTITFFWAYEDNEIARLARAKGVSPRKLVER